MIEEEGKKKLVKKVMIIDESVREALSGVMLRFPADSLIMLWKKKKNVVRLGDFSTMVPLFNACEELQSNVSQLQFEGKL